MQDLYDQANSRGEMRDWLCGTTPSQSKPFANAFIRTKANRRFSTASSASFLRIALNWKRTRAARAFAPNVKIALTKSFAAAMPGAASLRTVFRLASAFDSSATAALEKIGILLGESRDVWLTPWHALALKEKASFVSPSAVKQRT